MIESPADRNDRTCEAGSVSAFVLLLCLCLASLVGLVSEGGLVLSARETAVAEAEQAARAGAAELTPAALRAGGTSGAGPEAVAVAENFMALSGHPGTATDSHGVVTATVAAFRVSTPLLALAGVSSISITASASARAVDG
ncbi:MAG: pilus assembly protein TadG-related protein [Acidimicrobiales bacterium]